MTAGGDDVASRARAWRHAAHAAVCDVLEPWAHGTVARATRYPSYFDFNVVRVEDDPRMSVEQLVRFADDALAGLEHRRLDFDVAATAEPLRAGFEAAGWEAARLVWMHHERPPPPGPEIAVEVVPYGDAHELRVAGYHEDFPDHDPTEYLAAAHEVALTRDVAVLITREGKVPVGYAQLEREDAAAEITLVHVLREHRGAGRGTALTRAAIEAARGPRDLWICADDEDRPKELYARLGFSSAATTMQLSRLPPGLAHKH